MTFYSQAAEPFEELAVREAAPAVDMNAFYEKAAKEDAQRKLSRKGSRPGSKIWRRKRQADKQLGQQPSPPANKGAPGTEESIRTSADEQTETRDILSPLTSTGMDVGRSIVPDTAATIPEWYAKDESTRHQTRFNIHNPFGPQRYYNHHLLPPSARKQASRPPSIFSPSFPPMAVNQDPDDPTRQRSPSRTPSNSPLPTPSSSQVRLDQPRSRKTSQTARDEVDMLDASDPWGTNWHHQSPYDIGSTHNVNTVDVELSQNRSRHTSVTTRERRRTVTPSPLSQSTSAIHLAPPTDSSGGRVTRKLSKRRNSALGIFSDARNGPPPAAYFNEKLAPVTLADPGVVSGPPSSLKPPSISASTSKKERRGSVLGRIAKRFSILRRHDKEPSAPAEPHNMVVTRTRSPEKQQAPARVPPPPLEPEPQVQPRSPSPAPMMVASVETAPPESYTSRASLSSIEQPFLIGRLTVANPDDVPSSNTTPQQPAISLPDPSAAVPAPNLIESGLKRQEIIGTASSVPASSMEVLVETMRPQTQGTSISSTSHAAATRIQPNGATFSTATSPVANAYQDNKEKRKSRSPEKKPVPSLYPAEPAPNTSSIHTPYIPFPLDSRYSTTSSDGTVPPYLHAMISSGIDYSPMSNASLAVHPPTPVHIDTNIPAPHSPAPAVPPKDGLSRESEIFMLVPRGGNEYDVVEGKEKHRSRRESAKSRSHSKHGSRDAARLQEEARARDEAELAAREADAKARAEAKAKAMAEAKAREEAEARREAKARAEAEALKAQAKREARLRAEAESRARAEAEARAKADAEAKAKAEAEAKAKADAKAKARAEAEAKARAQAEIEAKARAKAEAEAQVEAETQARRAAREERHRREKHERDERHRREKEERRRERKEKEAQEEREYRREREEKERRRSERSSRRSVDIPSSTTGHSRRSRRGSSSDQQRSSTSEIRRSVDTSSRKSTAVALDTPSRKSTSAHVDTSSRKSHSVPVDINKPQPAPPPPPPKPLERNKSQSVRPTSEVPASDQLNSLKSKEAWDLERLFKAQSMYGMGAATAGPAVISIPSPAASNAAPMPPAKPPHGSSHTSFGIQNPFRPPQPFPRSAAELLPPIRPNPLPEPPRDSSYQPTGLDALLDDGPGSDHWTHKYGVTT
ncbi:hypothetical protein CYLTODRAFT_491818 [Cylindrobasidium torrendii FP15055 ss-10]|uniref:Uncharacterized protein n=1 Tax=Cylindrobasidium torrendii FP15055 ss-10 TaxID=1314674 RepID=A0A0D7B764_9AGAR|nr:hypothetical protein CYLTODRAFT_491818 [Cylindrobasidium torrendii FP15055 ss-10]